MAATNLYKKFLQGIGLIPKASTTNAVVGDLEVLTDNRLHFFGASNDSVTTDAVSTTLTNKALSDSTTSIVDAGDATKKILFDAGGTTGTTSTITGAQTASRVLTLPDATDTLAGISATQTLTNKTIDAGSNTITGLTNTNLSGSAAITNANLANMASSSSTVGTVKGNISGSATTPSDVVLTSANTASSAVYRDGSGNFSAGTITATLSGNATNVTGTVAIANGGTGQTTKTAAFDALQPMTTGGDIIYGGASGSGTRLANGTSGQFLKSNGGTAAPSWANPSINLLTPNLQSLLSGTSATYGLSYWFTCTSANATAAATYTNNGQTFTVVRTIAAGTLLLCTSTGAPSASGTLTKATGTGDATITFSAFTAPIYLRIRAAGGGGGGSGGGTGAGTGSGGGTTTFGSLVSCTGGGSGGQGAAAASLIGGVGTVTAPAIGIGKQGQSINGTVPSGGNGATGGQGGMTSFGGNGTGGWAAGGTGSAAVANTGSGGGGGGASASVFAGCGGTAGGEVDCLVYNPSATYTYTIGAGGAGTAGGTSGAAGGNGATGVIYVEEFFQ